MHGGLHFIRIPLVDLFRSASLFDLVRYRHPLDQDLVERGLPIIQYSILIYFASKAIRSFGNSSTQPSK